MELGKFIKDPGLSFFFAPFAVHCILCDTALIPAVQRYRKTRNELQSAQGIACICEDDS
jgi:hypothetical protein